MVDKTDELEMKEILENYKKDTSDISNSADSSTNKILVSRKYEKDNTVKSYLIMNIVLICVFVASCIAGIIVTSLNPKFSSFEKGLFISLLVIVVLVATIVMIFMVIKKRKQAQKVYEDQDLIYYSEDSFVIMDETKKKVNFSDIKKCTISEKTIDKQKMFDVSLLLNNSEIINCENILDICDFKIVLESKNIEII